MAEDKLKILSSTLADIYMRQGHFDKARDVYEKLLSKDHSNGLYKSRLMLLSKESPETKKLKILSVLLKKVEDRLNDRYTNR
jgi:pentatricopeptide repeat protein